MLGGHEAIGGAASEQEGDDAPDPADDAEQTDNPRHGRISAVTGTPFTEHEKRNIVHDAVPPHPFASERERTEEETAEHEIPAAFDRLAGTGGYPPNIIPGQE